MKTNNNTPAAVQIAVIGLGTVGGGAITVLCQNSDVIAARALPIRVKRVVDLDAQRAAGLCEKLNLPQSIISSRWQDAVEDPEIDVIVEVIGGVTVARDLISAALKAGKSVVTANKDLMAAHGGELLQMAADHHVDLFFEASVAGGIPVIQAVKESLAGNRFSQIMGILNGTTNYILTMMCEKGADFAQALSEAQALGFAEADPTNDVEGYDAARKIAILASIAYNSRVSDSMVATEGISQISKWDIAYADEFGYVIKSIGLARFDGEMIDVRVHPAMIKKGHPLASVRDSYNAVFVTGDAVENAMFYGRGAGSLPTGSAIAGDVIAAARNIAHGSRNRWGCTCYQQLPIRPLADVVSKYYVRIQVYDRVGVFAAMAKVLGDCQVSMDSVMQKRRIDAEQTEIVVITHKVRHENLVKALNALTDLDCVVKVNNYIRVEDEDI
ncbi:MAG: homoserine dehydrogenase [Firmicutes bacterium]|nr:homoserine dehydrogenase [Bacillota bacterium]